jgi:hypothetical protein
MLHCVAPLVLASLAFAQARLVDPPHLPPVRSPQGTVDPTTGELYVMGGRDDHVLDVWRLHNGGWQRVAEGPFTGVVSSLVFDPVHQRLLACATDDAGYTKLMALDGTTWTTASTAVIPGSTLLWHPVRAEVLVWMPPFWSPTVTTTTHTLWSWNGTVLAPVSMAGLAWLASPGSRIGYDSVRNRLVAPQTSYSTSLAWVHEWDGTTWTTVVSSGGAGGGYQIFTDPFTGRVVFGSTNSSLPSTAWTGQSFVPWSLLGAPTRRDAVLVGNPVRQVCQLVGGAWPQFSPHADVWEFGGTTWQQVAPDMVDPEFGEPVMVAIGARRALVFDGTSTAVWDDGVWTVPQPAHSPSSRNGFALAGDPATGRAFLFGGVSGNTVHADFWMWDGVDWLQLPGGPSGRADHGLCFRSDAQRVVLHGGTTSSGAANYETWEWDGASWSLRNATFPPHIGPCRLSWHERRQRTVLTTFGLNGIEVWEWDGASWFSTNPPSRPQLGQAGLIATYDPVRETIHVVAAAPTWVSPMSLGAIHEWDGGMWRSHAPEARLRGNRFAAAGVPGRGLVVANGSGRLTLTLEHDFPAVVTSLGSACPASSPAISANQPWLGRTYTLRYPCGPGTVCLFASGFSSTQWNGLPLPIDLAAIGLPGCNLRVAADVSDLRTPVAGAASLAIVLPASSALAGMRLFHQAAALTGGFTAVSQGIEIVTGSLW